MAETTGSAEKRTAEIVVDNFACGGGASEGIETALGRPVDIAINHNAKALAVHQANHPRTLHLREDIRDLDPRRVGAGRPVGLGWFSPDCTYHSKARGGKPFRDRDRARRVRGLAWTVVRWAKERRPRVIMLENVEEFADWGPLLEDGRPDPARRGLTFRRWHRQLENLGYRVDMRELRACPQGEGPTPDRGPLVGNTSKLVSSSRGTASESPALLTLVADYLETQTDALEECHTTAGQNDCDPEVAEECAEVRDWIGQLRAMARPVVTEEMVNRFLSWPLPKSVCSDLCVTDNAYKFPRFGTSLLAADEARAMLEYVLSGAPGSAEKANDE